MITNYSEHTNQLVCNTSKIGEISITHMESAFSFSWPLRSWPLFGSIERRVISFEMTMMEVSLL